MQLMALLNCLTGLHEPLRHKVKIEGTSYIGQCRHCGRPIKRVAHRNWRARGH
jgi:hypothetical protein